MDEAGIEAENRTLTWHSIRHSTGMYVYNQERDLSLVAEILRHKSLESARKYAHPTPETKRNIVENLHGGI
jgi:site-specific recombinase XerD